VVNVTINQIIKILIFIYNVKTKKYWKSVEELENGSIVALRNNEFVEAIPTEEFLGSKEQCLLQHHVVTFKVR
jgi:MoCo/4Fe-4S cofactor protein with predicted Tat translocation signal